MITPQERYYDEDHYYGGGFHPDEPEEDPPEHGDCWAPASQYWVGIVIEADGTISDKASGVAVSDIVSDLSLVEMPLEDGQRVEIGRAAMWPDVDDDGRDRSTITPSWRKE